MKKERVAKKREGGGGVARILFFNWVIYDPSDDLRSYSDDDCFVFTVRKKTTRSSSFFFFACHSPFLPSLFFLACLNLSAFFPPFFLLRTTRRQTSNVLFRYILASFSAYTLACASSSEGFSFFPFFCALRTRKKRFRKEEENTRSCEGKRT